MSRPDPARIPDLIGRAGPRWCSTATIRLNVKMELGSTGAIKQAVAGGLGLAIMSRHALSLLTGGEPLVELSVQGLPLQRHWYVVTPRGKQLSVVAKTCLEFLHDHVKMLEPARRAGA